MSDILRKKYEELDRYLGELKREFDLKLVILFGSLVRGTWMESSDIDLLIVAENLSDDPGENFTRLKRPGIDPHGFSVNRFLMELEKPNLIIFDALEYGEKIFADEEFFRGVKEKIREVKERLGLRWVGDTWVWRREE
ncbi:MAG: nucleotidyltransferase domain-containing protein [Nitrososphaeria archaeon]|nr:nucleotidyltransferase domain-containing protein [Aigarchaeota archaeon]MCX8188054.1 nucleotidyltransferase domain-containing protein [Nitrososphaeria archaeon]